MLQNNLLTNGSTTSLIDENGKFYSLNSLMENVFSYVRLIRFAKLSAENNTIGIYYKDTFSAISAFLACILEPVNFTLLSAQDTKEQTLVKINHAGVTILFSDVISSINILTINNDFLVIKEGVEINHLLPEQRKEFFTFCEQMLNLKTQIVTEKELLDTFKRVSNPYSMSKHRHYIGFHSGVTSLFKASVFQIEALFIGLTKAKEQLHANSEEKLLCLEPFTLIYDIISGVLAPILAGKTVILGTLPKSGINYSPTALYINSSRLDSILNSIEREDKFMFNLRNVKVLNSLGLNIIRWFRAKSKFNAVFGNAVKTIYITGKLGKKDYSFNNQVSIVNLFCIAEVSSFISCKHFKKYLPNKPHSVGVVDEFTSVMDGTPGELFVFAKDSCISYLQQNHIEYSFIHGFPGKIRTGDAGYIKDNELYVLGKAKFIYIKNNSVIETEKILDIVHRETFVNHCAVLKYENKLAVIFDLNKNYILLNNTLTYERLLLKCNELKAAINECVNEHSKVEKVVLYPDPEGMQEINYKLVSRSF